MLSKLIKKTLFASPTSFFVSISSRKCSSIEETIKDYQEIIKTPEDEKAVREILLELQLLQYKSNDAPQSIPSKYMLEMMRDLKTRPQRIKVMKYLKVREDRIAQKMKSNHKPKNPSETTQYPIGRLFDEENKPIYKKYHNSLFGSYIRDTDISHSHDYKKRHAALFGQRLIVDLGFEEVNSFTSSKFIAFQLSSLYAMNYQSSDPFDLTFSSFNAESRSGQEIANRIPNLSDARTMISLETKSFQELEILPEQLVYISAFSREPYLDVNVDDVLVVPALDEHELAFKKAKKEGLRVLCLPFDQYVLWKTSYRTLSISRIVKIILDYKNNGRDWHKAFTYDGVLSKRIKPSEEVVRELERHKRRGNDRRQLLK